MSTFLGLRRSFRSREGKGNKENDEEPPSPQSEPSVNQLPHQQMITLADLGEKIEFPHEKIQNDKSTGRLQRFTIVWSIPSIVKIEPIKQYFFRSQLVGGFDLGIREEAKFYLVLKEENGGNYTFVIDCSYRESGMLGFCPISGKCRILKSDGKYSKSEFDIRPNIWGYSGYYGVEGIINRKKLFSKYSKLFRIEAEIEVPDTPASRSHILPACDLIRMRRHRQAHKHNFVLRSSESRDFHVNFEILKSSSGFFDRHLKELSSKPEKNLFIMNDVPNRILTLIVDYLHGEADKFSEALKAALQGKIVDVLEASRKYEFELLRDVCNQLLEKEELHLDNAVDLFIQAHRAGLAKRTQEIATYIRRKQGHFAKNGGLERIKNYNWDALNSYILSAIDEPTSGPTSRVKGSTDL